MKRVPVLLPATCATLAPILALALWTSPAEAQTTRPAEQAGTTRPAAPKPEVWMGPPAYDNGRCLRELFEHPDQWAATRERVDVISYTDLNFTKQFKDDQELRRWLVMLADWKIKLALEVGAIKPWSHTGARTFEIEKPMWDRLRRLGGRIHAVAMDEPLLCCRKHIHKDDEHALRETAEYVAAVRRYDPSILVGDIEPYPSVPLADHYRWIESLNARLAERKVRGLDFYRLDVNWAEFVAFNRGSWREVRQLELHCRRLKLPFSLIYWASLFPAMQRKGLGDDAAWYVGVMQQGYDYALVDGRPDQIMVESWVAGPSRCVPDTADFTFTRSVLDLTKRLGR
ncbi:MAG TPA: hypothetical protein PKG77_02535 [Phycisphaerae bacterium]|nr:hypothetical protein [Phycisphaerae bacterium]HQL72185.1 hypothetical protein [Phycisphaerae bacterium]